MAKSWLHQLLLSEKKTEAYKSVGIRWCTWTATYKTLRTRRSRSWWHYGGSPGNASVEAVWVQPGGAGVEAVGSQPGARWRQDSRRDRGSPGRVGVEVVGGSSGRTNVQAVVGSPGHAGVEAIGGSSGRAGVEGSAKFHTRRCFWERGGGTPGFPLVDQVSRSPNTTSHSQHL
jgi:hypothetical protein